MSRYRATEASWDSDEDDELLSFHTFPKLKASEEDEELDEEALLGSDDESSSSKKSTKVAPVTQAKSVALKSAKNREVSPVVVKKNEVTQVKSDTNAKKVPLKTSSVQSNVKVPLNNNKKQTAIADTTKISSVPVKSKSTSNGAVKRTSSGVSTKSVVSSATSSVKTSAIKSPQPPPPKQKKKITPIVFEPEPEPVLQLDPEESFDFNEDVSESLIDSSQSESFEPEEYRTNLTEVQDDQEFEESREDISLEVSVANISKDLSDDSESDEEGSSRHGRFRTERRQGTETIKIVSSKSRNTIPDTLEISQEQQAEIDQFLQTGSSRNRHIRARGRGRGNIQNRLGPQRNRQPEGSVMQQRETHLPQPVVSNYQQNYPIHQPPEQMSSPSKPPTQKIHINPHFRGKNSAGPTQDGIIAAPSVAPPPMFTAPHPQPQPQYQAPPVMAHTTPVSLARSEEWNPHIGQPPVYAPQPANLHHPQHIIHHPPHPHYDARHFHPGDPRPMQPYPAYQGRPPVSHPMSFQPQPRPPQHQIPHARPAPYPGQPPITHEHQFRPPLPPHEHFISQQRPPYHPRQPPPQELVRVHLNQFIQPVQQPQIPHQRFAPPPAQHPPAQPRMEFRQPLQHQQPPRQEYRQPPPVFPRQQHPRFENHSNQPKPQSFQPGMSSPQHQQPRQIPRNRQNPVVNRQKQTVLAQHAKKLRERARKFATQQQQIPVIGGGAQKRPSQEGPSLDPSPTKQMKVNVQPTSEMTIDPEMKRKLEEQARMREEIRQRKEANRLAEAQKKREELQKRLANKGQTIEDVEMSMEQPTQKKLAIKSSGNQPKPDSQGSKQIQQARQVNPPKTVIKTNPSGTQSKKIQLNKNISTPQQPQQQVGQKGQTKGPIKMRKVITTRKSALTGKVIAEETKLIPFDDNEEEEASQPGNTRVVQSSQTAGDVASNNRTVIARTPANRSVVKPQATNRSVMMKDDGNQAPLNRRVVVNNKSTLNRKVLIQNISSSTSDTILKNLCSVVGPVEQSTNFLSYDGVQFISGGEKLVKMYQGRNHASKAPCRPCLHKCQSTEFLKKKLK